jgi:ABC-type polysaccharide/polyol phosphate transport system ATPase subunit
LTKFAIQVESLGKEYTIGGAEQRHDSFREMLTGALTAPLRKLRKLGGTASKEERFWALRDVSFNVEQGEVLGIIGRNGAGKSTLLKVLSRITSPTVGRVVTRGRVASLLEVGTGFHPELTGRENIYLNGAILGMSRAEIDSQFEEIVAFAEIDQFLDTPAKRYSSGMYVRLAFSVAAHLDADIMVVDEVLAVGDIRFQRKCLGKMKNIAGGGRTVLFVSHNLNAIQALCGRSILLDGGRLLVCDATATVIENYLSEYADDVGVTHVDSNRIKVLSLQADYEPCGIGKAKLKIVARIAALNACADLYIDFGIENGAQVRVLQFVPKAKGQAAVTVPAGAELTYAVTADLTSLAPGDYCGTIFVHSDGTVVHLHQSNIKLFRVKPEPQCPESMSPNFSALLVPDYKIEVEARAP